MKKILFFLAILLTTTHISFAQNRVVTRGAEPSELYLTSVWYGIYNPIYPAYYDTLQMAIYHLTENGKKLSIQYDADYFANPETILLPEYILADATPGVLYGRGYYSKNSYSHTSLWVSFDYGKNWTFREENMGNLIYFPANIEGLIYRTGSDWNDGTFKSDDYATTFIMIDNTSMFISEPGFEECEFFSFALRELSHTYDCFQNYVNITIDEEFAYGLTGKKTDVYRGGLQGEVYIDSWFPDWSYKVSFSADTGHTFRHVFICEDCNPYIGEQIKISFMSDREPGVFYIIRRWDVEDLHPRGHHTKICIDYYRDYGETLEATFCHDLHKNYGYEEVICDHTTHLEAEVVNQNSIQLQWSNSADNIRGYHVFKNNVRITSELLTNTSYLDEDLPNGVYEYYVRTYYEEGCVSDSSNHVVATLTVGIKEIDDLEDILLFPNPTTGKLQVVSYKLRVNGIEIFDVYGRKLKAEGRKQNEMNISELCAGVYFVQVSTEKGRITKKIIKY